MQSTAANDEHAAPRVRWWLALTVVLVAGLLTQTTDARAATEELPEWDFAGAINSARFDAGLPPLGVLTSFRDVGRAQSVRMAEQNRLHHNPNLQADVEAHAPDWERAGENVGRGYDVPGLHDAFMNSPAHRANVLGDYNYVGVGVVMADRVMWVTEVFLKAPPGKATATRVPLTRVSCSAAADLDMAVAVSSYGFPPGESDAVVVGRSDVFADVLAGGPLAAVNHGPVLLTSADSVPPNVVAEAKRVLKPDGVVYLLGGVEAVSPAVDAAFLGVGLRVERIAGADRYGTAATVALSVNPNPKEVMLVSGIDFADALVVSPPATLRRAPILLTPPDDLAGATRAYLATVPLAERVVVGGIAAVPQAVADQAGASDRVAGADRYDTAVKVAQRWYDGATQLSLAPGRTFQDALVGGPYSARAGSPVILVAPSTSPSVYRYVRDRVEGLAGSTVLGTDHDVPLEPLTLLFT